MGPGALAPPPEPADVGIVAALPIEVGPLVDRLEKTRTYAAGRLRVVEGELSGKVVALIVGGPGRAAARKAAGLLVDGHRPRWMISAGFAGALDPELRRDAVVFADQVMDEEGTRLAIDVTIPRAGGIAPGRLVTVDRIVRTAAEKAELRRATGADVVDMETSAVAALCAERKVRFLAIRVVSDEAGTDLPPEVLTILGRSGGYRLGAAFGAIWRRPSSLKDLLALRGHALSAADRLADVVAGAVAQLP